MELNCDMGEGYGLYTIGNDEGLMPLISVANVACGFHASDPTIMHKTVRLAKQHGVRVGAHPSLPDRQGFGRRTMVISSDELTDMLIYQVGALKAFLDVEGIPLNHIKPHGALYGMAARDEAIAHAVCDVAEAFDVPLYGMAGTLHEEIYPARGIGFYREFYVDLDYDNDGNLIITRSHVPIGIAKAKERMLRLFNEKVALSQDGVRLPMDPDLVCVHSDTPDAVAVAEVVRDVIHQSETNSG